MDAPPRLPRMQRGPAMGIERRSLARHWARPSVSVRCAPRRLRKEKRTPDLRSHLPLLDGRQENGIARGEFRCGPEVERVPGCRVDPLSTGACSQSRGLACGDQALARFRNRPMRPG